MSFHDIRFPVEISYGSKGGPEFNTSVLELASGFEKRNINWSQVRARYDVAHGVKTMEQMEALRDFFYARQGKAYSFRFKDFLDFEIMNQQIGVGDGVTRKFQIYKTYTSGVNFYNRLITKIVQGTVGGVFVGATPVLNPETCIDLNTGVLTLPPAINTPLVDVPVTVSYCEFDVHVRFDTDHFDATHDQWETMSWSSIPLVEIKEKWL